MNLRWNGTAIFSICLIAFVLAMVIGSFSFPFEVRITPLMVGSVSLLFLVLLVVGEFHPTLLEWTEATLEDLWGGRQKRNHRIKSGGRNADWPSVLKILIYIFGFWLAVFLIGLAVVPPLFIAIFLIFEADVKIRYATFAALLACLLIIGSLNLMNVDIWAGVIPELIPGYIGGSIMPII